MSPITRVGPFTALLTALLLTGCAAIHENAYLQAGVDLRRYHTYAWGPAGGGSTGDPRLDNNRFFDERVRLQVEKQLASRGFEKAASGVPDLLVHYHASLTQKIDAGALDHRYDDSESPGRGPEVYDAGTLFVDLVDARTTRLVWRGWMEGGVDGAIDDQAGMEALIDAAVTRILQRLPRRL